MTEFEECATLLQNVRSEFEKRIVGQKNALDGILTAVISGGHILLEGVPGLGKTLLAKTFCEIADLTFKRIQFTPDLLPADIIGTTFFENSSGKFFVRKGPIFANVVLADEINRAGAKVQSALLESMEENQVTIGDETFSLSNPFFVLATQNPIEQEGTYDLPEAEADRFLLKVCLDFPSCDEEILISKTEGYAKNIPIEKILNAEKIFQIQKTLQNIKCDEKIISYAVSIVRATRPNKTLKNFENSAVHKNQKFTKIFSGAPLSLSSEFDRFINFGASPRASISLLKCAKVNALFCGRDFVLPEDVKKVAVQVLHHRIVLSYEASAEGIGEDDLIFRILDFVPVP